MVDYNTPLKKLTMLMTLTSIEYDYSNIYGLSALSAPSLKLPQL